MEAAMLLEFGAIAVDAQCPVLEPIDWTLLLEIFKEEFSASRLANVMWEDIVLIADRESSVTI
ncbi:hypothetical protein PSHT_05010, partial [Puccinia striiformis]